MVGKREVQSVRVNGDIEPNFQNAVIPAQARIHVTLNRWAEYYFARSWPIGQSHKAPKKIPKHTWIPACAGMTKKRWQEISTNYNAQISPHPPKEH